MRFASKGEVDQFRQLADFEAYRREDPIAVVVKANLKDWNPKTRDLRGLKLKACDFRSSDLRAVDFTGANLTLGKFQGAHLEEANFADADLEGADFSGAFLSGAKFENNELSATVFQSPDGEGLASSEGILVASPRGLLESQEAYLRLLGVLRE